jgi:hypothetical protein
MYYNTASTAFDIVQSRHWKDHFKSDFRSDQDHLLEKWYQIKINFFLMILISNQDQRSFFVPKVPFLRVKISKRTKSRLWTFEITYMTFLTSNQTKRWHQRFLYLFSCFLTYFDKCLLAFNISSPKWSDLFENMATKWS